MKNWSVKNQEKVREIKKFFSKSTPYNKEGRWTHPRDFSLANSPCFIKNENLIKIHFFFKTNKKFQLSEVNECYTFRGMFYYEVAVSVD